MNKAKAVFDLLLSHIAYCGDSGGQNVVNALIERRAVCKGMSKAYQYLLSGLGVFVTSLTGELRGSRHQWNLVRVNGVYYHVDLSLSYPAFDFLFPEALANDRYRTFLFSDRFLAGLGVKEDRDVRRPPCTLSYQEESK